VSHTFAPKSVLEFEPYIHQNLDLFVKQWDRASSNPEADGAGRLDCLSWCELKRLEGY
jgi:benzoate 4-monooxygenase